MKNTVIAVGASLIFLLSAAPATAQSDSFLYERVSVADLNLNSREGLARMDARILAAARRLCADSGATGPQSSPRLKNCVIEAVASAKQQRARLVSAARQTRETALHMN